MPPLAGSKRAPSLYIGVDPGASGGLACITPTAALAIPTPKTERDVWDWLSARGRESVDDPVFAVIEKVGGFIKGNPAPGSAMFNFGASYGGLRMALIAAGIPFEEVPPQRWQKALAIPPKKRDETKTQFKNRLKARAQQLFPSEKVTLATADALLIAEYCRRLREGKL